MNTSKLNFITALHCEAKPLIDEYQLKKITNQTTPFPIFTNKNETIHLIIAGVGKIKTAIATTFLAQWTGNKSHTCYLNIGIAGATQFNLSEAVLINKITEASTQRNWYPFTSHLKYKKQAHLFTHDTPQTNYPDAGLVDMEGSAFFQTATCFVTQEQVQLIKIISDNNLETQTQITEERVKHIIQQNLSTISDIAHQLTLLSEKEYELNQEPLAYTQFQSQWHFTHAQTLQLKEYLRRWQTLLHQEDPLLHCQHEKNAKQVLQKIIMKLDNHANSLY